MPVLGDAANERSLGKRFLGPAAARARNRPSMCPPRAALAGKGSEKRRNLLELRRFQRCTGRL